MGEASEEELIQRWNYELEKQNNMYQSNQIENNFVEITRLPKKIDAVSKCETNLICLIF